MSRNSLAPRCYGVAALSIHCTIHIPVVHCLFADTGRSTVMAVDDPDIDIESETPPHLSSARVDQRHARARKRVCSDFGDGAQGVGAGRESESSGDPLPRSKSVKYSS